MPALAIQPHESERLAAWRGIARQNRVSVEVVDEVADLWDSGRDTDDIGKILKLHQATAERVLHAIRDERRSG